MNEKKKLKHYWKSRAFRIYPYFLPLVPNSGIIQCTLNKISHNDNKRDAWYIYDFSFIPIWELKYECLLND